MCRRINTVFVNKDGLLLITLQQYQCLYRFFYIKGYYSGKVMITCFCLLDIDYLLLMPGKKQKPDKMCNENRDMEKRKERPVLLKPEIIGNMNPTKEFSSGHTFFSFKL